MEFNPYQYDGSIPAAAINVDPSVNITVVGANGEIWYYTAGAWSSKTQNINISTFKGSGIDGTNYYTVSNDGTVLSSSNSGLSWVTNITASNTDLADIAANSGNATAVGSAGKWLYTSGATWNSGSNGSFTTNLRAVIYNSGNAYAVGEDCSILEISGATSTIMQPATGSD